VEKAYQQKYSKKEVRKAKTKTPKKPYKQTQVIKTR